MADVCGLPNKYECFYNATRATRLHNSVLQRMTERVGHNETMTIIVSAPTFREGGSCPKPVPSSCCRGLYRLSHGPHTAAACTHHAAHALDEAIQR